MSTFPISSRQGCRRVFNSEQQSTWRERHGETPPGFSTATLTLVASLLPHPLVHGRRGSVREFFCALCSPNAQPSLLRQQCWWLAAVSLLPISIPPAAACTSPAL
ncbi:hypothetical protein BDN70DRAFT_989775 [Pholiota conissans]|uniref:Uncharacterized protein n=1 Tax=Pholiota conissans TaxID=109636 RepID=A0A9P5ZBI5_9AGAR|nr:hypothetical protein BDN70DRAFT_989775 [Pholiota conissans]